MQINVNVCEWVEVVMRNEDGPSLPLLTCESSIWKNQIEKIWGSRLVWWLWLHVESLLIYTTIQHISVTKKCNIFVSYNGSTLAENNDSWKKIKKKACFCQTYVFYKLYIIQFMISYILLVSLKSGACYIISQWDKFGWKKLLYVFICSMIIFL